MRNASPPVVFSGLGGDYVAIQAQARQFLRSAFPGACDGLVDDAISQAFLEVLEQQAAEIGLPSRQPESLSSLIRLVAWRRLRDEYRRGSRRRETSDGADQLLGRPVPPGQERVVAAKEALSQVEHVASWVSPRMSAQLVEALWDKLAHGGTDQELAERHGVRREYINRARSALFDTLDFK